MPTAGVRYGSKEGSMGGWKPTAGVGYGSKNLKGHELCWEMESLRLRGFQELDGAFDNCGILRAGRILPG